MISISEKQKIKIMNMLSNHELPESIQIPNEFEVVFVEKVDGESQKFYVKVRIKNHVIKAECRYMSDTEARDTVNVSIMMKENFRVVTNAHCKNQEDQIIIDMAYSKYVTYAICAKYLEGQKEKTNENSCV